VTDSCYLRLGLICATRVRRLLITFRVVLVSRLIEPFVHCRLPQDLVTTDHCRPVAASSATQSIRRCHRRSPVDRIFYVVRPMALPTRSDVCHRIPVTPIQSPLTNHDKLVYLRTGNNFEFFCVSTSLRSHPDMKRTCGSSCPNRYIHCPTTESQWTANVVSLTGHVIRQ